MLKSGQRTIESSNDKMKAVIFFLLSLLAYAKSCPLQNVQNEAEYIRAVADVAYTLPTWLYHIVLPKKPGPPTGQWAILYLHANKTNPTLRYDSKEVSDMLNPEFKRKFSFGKNAYVWPQTDTTNLAVANIRHGCRMRGHTEYQLLKKLGAMLKAFRSKRNDCPSHVVIVTKQEPCAPDMNEQSKKLTGCTKEIINTFKAAKTVCPSAIFVVGYSAIHSDHQAYWQETEKCLNAQNIVTTMV